MSEATPPKALDHVLDALRKVPVSAKTEPLFEAESSQGLGPGVNLHLDPDARMSGYWSSPEGRLIELHTSVATPGAWFGLHIGLPADLDLAAVRWIGIVARSTAIRAVALRVCLRSGLPDGGFHDCFFPHHILSQGRQTDHHDLLCPAQHPDLPQRADWRELVLFLPPAEGIDWALHDLRLFAL